MPPDALRSTPSRLTASGAARLPGLLLLLIALAYILAGLFFRDPWKADDVIGLATMLTGLEQGGDAMLLPQVGNLAHAQSGPLTMWMGMLSITLFAPLFAWFVSPLDAAIVASRLPNLLWFAITAGALWLGVRRLGLQSEAQPMPLPFGGEPNRRDYGRLLADASLLLLIATAGITWRMHETSFVPALIAFQAVAFFACVRMLDCPRSGAVLLGLALGAAFLTRGGIGVLPVALAAFTLAFPGAALQHRRKWLALAIAIAAAIALAWWIPASQTSPYWVQQWKLWHTTSLGWPRLQVLFNIVRDLPWFLWPTWPFAILALWQWRGWMRAPHIAIPLRFLLLPLLCMLFLADVFEPEYSLLAVPCAVLAAFALPTLRRGVVNSLDWFAVMCFSLAIATVWLGWIAQQTGWPRQIAHNIARQTTGFEAIVLWPAVAVAALGTLAWILMAYWRLSRRPQVMWRGTFLYAGGAVATWLLLATLWMPSLDYARSYRHVSAQLAAALDAHLKPGECVRPYGLGLGQRASFLVFDGITFEFSADCPLVLQQSSPRIARDGTAGALDRAPVLWEGRRGPDRHELFRLLRVAP